MPRSKKGPEDASSANKAAKKTTASRAKKSTTKPVEVPVVTETASNDVAVAEIVAAHKEPIDIESQIRTRAYQLYLERNGSQGDPQQDWFRAEAEVRAKLIA